MYDYEYMYMIWNLYQCMHAYFMSLISTEIREVV